MSARGDETARPERHANNDEPRTSPRPPFQKRPNKLPHCPACVGGWPVEKQYQDEQGRTVSRLADEHCPECGGTGHLGDKTYAKGNRALSAESLGKLGGMDVTRWPVSRRRSEEP